MSTPKYWQRKDGKKVLPIHMDDQHLGNAIALAWRHVEACRRSQALTEFMIHDEWDKILNGQLQHWRAQLAVVLAENIRRHYCQTHEDCIVHHELALMCKASMRKAS